MVTMDGEDSAGESILTTVEPILDHSLAMDNMNGESSEGDTVFQAAVPILHQSLPMMRMGGSVEENIMSFGTPVLNHSLSLANGNREEEDFTGERIGTADIPILNHSLPSNIHDREDKSEEEHFQNAVPIFDHSLPLVSIDSTDFAADNILKTDEPILHHSLDQEDKDDMSETITSSKAKVIQEYEKTITLNIEQMETLKKKLLKAEVDKTGIIQERDQALEDLCNVENAFSDVHRKYERAKATLDSLKKNEEVLKQRDQEMTKNSHLLENKIELVKEQAQSTIESMHHDYESKINNAEMENMKLRALLRKTEMKISTLENDLEQKHKENAQLNALCDDLINGGVGNS